MSDKGIENKPQKKKSIHTGHRQRVIDKYIKCGIEAFAEHEILELILYYSIPQADTNPIAHRLIDEFGSLENVLNASVDELMLVDGVGRRSATLITLFRTVNAHKEKNLKNSKAFFRFEYQIGEFCKEYFKSHIDEEAILLCMDTSFNIKKIEKISSGTFNETAMYLGRIAQVALNTRAPVVVLSHNHPGGSLQPSPHDMHFTAKLYDLLDSMKITLYDHIICNEYHYTSMAERGMLKVTNNIDFEGGIK